MSCWQSLLPWHFATGSYRYAVNVEAKAAAGTLFACALSVGCFFATGNWE